MADSPVRSFGQAVLWAGAEAVYAGTWAAADGLSVWQRRLARATLVAGVLALAPAERATRAPKGEAPAEPVPGSEPVTGPSSLGDLAKPAAAVASGIVLAVVRRRLKQRWLTKLTESGHPHPHVALGVRLGATAFTLSLARHVIKTQENKRNP